MLQSVNLPPTTNNKRNHVVEELVDDLIKNWKLLISEIEFVSRVNYRYKKLHVI
jgi:hypothetical protein